MRKFSEAEREVVLRLLEDGCSAMEAHRRTGRQFDTVRRWARLAGMTFQSGRNGGPSPGTMPVLDPGRHKAGSQANRLDEFDRMAIQFGLEQGDTLAMIARRVGVDASTISREVARGRAGQDRYVARRAHTTAVKARARPRPRRLDANVELRAAVVDGLNQKFSPTQISARLRRDHFGRKEMQVSHETIYQALYVQGRGTLRHELTVDKALRSGRTSRIPASKLPPRTTRPWLVGHHISTRPAEVEDRAIPGHWEGDLIIGAHHKSSLITLVERASRFTMISRLPGPHDTVTVVDRLIAMAAGVPEELFKTLTWDQGAEMAEHPRWSLATGGQVYFCDPHSPWQRGSNENTNGLIRDFFPKSTDFRNITDAQITEAQHLLNIRPRQTLDWDTPAEKLTKLIGHALTP